MRCSAPAPRGHSVPRSLALVDRLNELEVPLVAVDGPTGVDLATGTTHGASVVAKLSITFGGLRRGHLLARDECGDVVVVDIGHPAADPDWPNFLTDIEAARVQGRFACPRSQGNSRPAGGHRRRARNERRTPARGPLGVCGRRGPGARGRSCGDHRRPGYGRTRSADAEARVHGSVVSRVDRTARPKPRRCGGPGAGPG